MFTFKGYVGVYNSVKGYWTVREGVRPIIGYYDSMELAQVAALTAWLKS